MANETAQSIYDLPPLETGGSRSRRGLAFQDHVTVGFCLDMFSEPRLVEVWCETQDDITLIWRDGESVTVEFVQAKSDEMDQLWSISGLCQRKHGKQGTSILERSLSNDRCAENVLFRLVAARPFNSELEVLTWERDSPARRLAHPDLERIQDELETKVGNFTSSNGNDCRHWALRALLDVRHSEEAVVNSNLLKMRRALEQRRSRALQDQIEEIYVRLVGTVADSSSLDARLRPDEKRYSRERFATLLDKATNNYLRPPNHGSGKTLQLKMEDAALPADTIEQAQELRRKYRRRSLTPRYQNSQDRPLLDEEVAAILQGLKADLDSGVLPDDGPQFFAICLKKLSEFRNQFPVAQRPALADLQGAMYSIADRCLHRYRRAIV